MEALDTDPCPSLRAARASIPAACLDLQPGRAWAALARTCAQTALGTTLLLLTGPFDPRRLATQVPLLVLGCLVSGWGMTGLFVIGHDCAHSAFSRRRWVNELVGSLCFAPLLTGFHAWRVSHDHHHRFTQMRGEDPDWPEKLLRNEELARLPLARWLFARVGLGSPLGILLGFWVGVSRRMFLPWTMPQVRLDRRAQRRVVGSSALALLVGLAILCGTVHAGGLELYVRVYLAPGTVSAVTGALLTFAQHSSADAVVFDREGWRRDDGQLASTFDVRFHPVLEAMWLDINVHQPHHVAPGIPWYHLRTASSALRQACPSLPPERPFRLADLVRAWARPSLVLTDTPGRHRMAALEPARVGRRVARWLRDRIPLGDVNGRFVLPPLEIRDAELGRSRGLPLPFALRFRVAEDSVGFPAGIGRSAFRHLFRHLPPFEVTVRFACGAPDPARRRGYADPRSPWFNVFVGYYEAVVRKSEWDRPFGYRRDASGRFAVDLEEVMRLGKADWNHFSNELYGVPAEVAAASDRLDADAPGQLLSPEVIGTRWWDRVVLPEVVVVSPYARPRDRSHVDRVPWIGALWREAFGRCAADVAGVQSFAKARMRAEMFIAFAESVDTWTGEPVFRTWIAGGTSNLDHEDAAASARLLELQLAEVRRVLVSMPELGFPGDAES